MGKVKTLQTQGKGNEGFMGIKLIKKQFNSAQINSGRILVDFENTPESFLARIDYRETEREGEFQAGERVFASLIEDTGTSATMGKEEAGGILCS